MIGVLLQADFLEFKRCLSLMFNPSMCDIVYCTPVFQLQVRDQLDPQIKAAKPKWIGDIALTECAAQLLVSGMAHLQSCLHWDAVCSQAAVLDNGAQQSMFTPSMSQARKAFPVQVHFW